MMEDVGTLKSTSGPGSTDAMKLTPISNNRESSIQQQPTFVATNPRRCVLPMPEKGEVIIKALVQAPSITLTASGSGQTAATAGAAGGTSTLPSSNEDARSRKRPVPPSDFFGEDANTTTTTTTEPSVKKARLIVFASMPPAGSSSQEAGRRTVHFEFHQPNNQTAATIKTQIRMFNRVDACDVANIWWSGDEIFAIMSRERSEVSVMSYCCDHYTSEVLNLVKMARDKTSLPGMATMESASPLWVASSPARGLERDIVQGFKQRKRQVIRKVLESQRVLKMGRHNVTGEEAPPELRSQLLSRQYIKWSHPMVRFAQVLAEGDAQVVIDAAEAAAPAPPPTAAATEGGDTPTTLEAY